MMSYVVPEPPYSLLLVDIVLGRYGIYVRFKFVICYNKTESNCLLSRKFINF